MAQLVWSIVVALLVLGAATRLGLGLLRAFSLTALTTGERWLFAVAVGLGGLAILSLIMGRPDCCTLSCWVRYFWD